MNKKGIAFIDDFVDNLITFILIIIVFVMVFFITSSARNAIEENYKTHLRAVENAEYLTDLLRLETSTGETVQELLRNPENDAHKKLSEEFIIAYYNGIYGDGYWSVLIDYPNLQIKLGDTKSLKKYTTISGTGKPSVTRLFKFGDVAQTHFITEAEVGKPDIGTITVQAPIW